MSDNKSDNKKDQEYEIAEQVFVKKSNEVKLDESKYSRAEILANAQAIFGVMPEVVAGALHGNKSEELTISEVKKAIKQFLRRGVS